MNLSFSFFYLLLERDFLIVALSAIAAFATIVTLGLPYMQKDVLEGRMRAVAERREELRQKKRDAFAKGNRNKGQLRSTPVGFMKQTLDNLKLEKMLESPGMKEKLARAGYRGQGPLVTFMFFRFLMPPVVFIGAVIYVFGVSHVTCSFSMQLLASVGAAVIVYSLPTICLT